MRRWVGMALLGAIVFAAVVVVRLPAEWIIPSRAAGFCLTIEGSDWRGSCAGLVLSGVPVGDLTWNLQPLRLL
ncbi:MAG: type II secretion system protein N, partial [Gammaproteobacteria bacterium]|nr:type II secretion system protein N [Gammaproteobacteria bacterium]